MFDYLTTAILIVAEVLVGIATLILIRRYVDDTINSVIDGFTEVVSTPTVKSAMSILGKKGAESRASSSMVDKIASDVLSGPKMQAIKIGASALGLDLDGYVEEHGAMATLQGMQSVAGMLGIDINTMLAGGGQVQTGSGGKNPYI